jgi:hypothetical protein
VGDPITAAGRLTREASANGGEVNTGPNLLLVEAKGVFEPTEESLARGVGEGPAEDRLTHSRRLTNQHHSGEDRST